MDYLPKFEPLSNPLRFPLECEDFAKVKKKKKLSLNQKIQHWITLRIIVFVHSGRVFVWKILMGSCNNRTNWYKTKAAFSQWVSIIVYSVRLSASSEEKTVPAVLLRELHLPYTILNCDLSCMMCWPGNHSFLTMNEVCFNWIFFPLCIMCKKFFQKKTSKNKKIRLIMFNVYTC